MLSMCETVTYYKLFFIEAYENHEKTIKTVAVDPRLSTCELATLVKKSKNNNLNCMTALIVQSLERDVYFKVFKK